MTITKWVNRGVELLMGAVLVMILGCTDITVQAASLYGTDTQETAQSEEEREMVEIEEEEVPLEVTTACTAHWSVLALLGCYAIAGIVGIMKKADMRRNVIASAIFVVALVATGFFWKCRLDLYLTVVSGAVVVAFNVIHFEINGKLFLEEK